MINPFSSNISKDNFNQVLSYLTLKDLVRTERVCKFFKTFIEQTEQWKKKCQEIMNLPSKIDPKHFLPDDCSYKRGAFTAASVVLDAKLYGCFAAKIVPVPPIPREISLEIASEPDPYERTKKIGENYVWFYIPTESEIPTKKVYEDIFSQFYFKLDKAENTGDSDAPRLMAVEEIQEKTTLKVPTTIWNVDQVSKKYITKGCTIAHDEIYRQHYSRKIQSGWVCMRKGVIEKGKPIEEQIETANRLHLDLVSLDQAVIFNLLMRRNTERYADSEDPKTSATEERGKASLHDFTFAATSTYTILQNGGQLMTGCGTGEAGELVLDYVACNEKRERPGRRSSLGPCWFFRLVSCLERGDNHRIQNRGKS